jgi:Domain of unknown function (DUF4345)
MNTATSGTLHSPAPPQLVTKIVLVLAGVVAAFIGVSLLTNPQRFYSSYGLALTADPSMFSEFRGAGAMLLSAALGLTFGAFVDRYRAHVALLGSVLYLGYAGGRAVGIGLDGLPHSNLIYAALAELVLGLACAAVFARESQRVNP